MWMHNLCNEHTEIQCNGLRFGRLEICENAQIITLHTRLLESFSICSNEHTDFRNHLKSGLEGGWQFPHNRMLSSYWQELLKQMRLDQLSAGGRLLPLQRWTEASPSCLWRALAHEMVEEGFGRNSFFVPPVFSLSFFLFFLSTIDFKFFLYLLFNNCNTNHHHSLRWNFSKRFWNDLLIK